MKLVPLLKHWLRPLKFHQFSSASLPFFIEVLLKLYLVHPQKPYTPSLFDLPVTGSQELKLVHAVITELISNHYISFTLFFYVPNKLHITVNNKYHVYITSVQYHAFMYYSTCIHHTHFFVHTYVENVSSPTFQYAVGSVKIV